MGGCRIYQREVVVDVGLLACNFRRVGWDTVVSGVSIAPTKAL